MLRLLNYVQMGKVFRQQGEHTFINVVLKTIEIRFLWYRISESSFVTLALVLILQIWLNLLVLFAMEPVHILVQFLNRLKTVVIRSNVNCSHESHERSLKRPAKVTDCEISCQILQTHLVSTSNLVFSSTRSQYREVLSCVTQICWKRNSLAVHQFFNFIWQMWQINQLWKLLCFPSIWETLRNMFISFPRSQC